MSDFEFFFTFLFGPIGMFLTGLIVYFSPCGSLRRTGLRRSDTGSGPIASTRTRLSAPSFAFPQIRP